ncbi:MAG: aldehyde dehydrogenase family protein [Balneolaceae bacterium]|nr:aldehyde dehydrogenase family protein [Balneolaceae bacterium]
MKKLSKITLDFLNRSPKLFIGNEWVDSFSSETIPSVNPANGEEIFRIAEANDQDVDHAVDAARKAFHKTVRDMNPSKRALKIQRLADLIEDHLEPLSQLECLDNGKPISRAVADVKAAAAHLRYFAGWSDKIEGSSIPVHSPNIMVYTRREPVGVAALIVPWNFPLVMAIWKMAPALACGNCCILKPAEQTSVTALYLANLIKEAGFPSGMVQVLTGGGKTGALLSHHMDIDKIGFTGSTEVGKKVLEASSKSNLKKVSLELGGKSPNIIFDDADMDRVHQSLVWASFYNSGQECTLGSRVYVHKKNFAEVVDKLVQKASELSMDSGLLNPDLGPLVSKEQVDRVMGYIDSGKNEAELILGGQRKEGDLSGGYFVEPTIFSTSNHNAKIVREEIFGPVVNVTSFEDEEEIIAYANNSRYGLASAIWTKDISRAHRFAHRIEAGVVWINSYDLFHPAVPFGGFKESGIGREMGKSALELYTREKAIWTQL